MGLCRCRLNDQVNNVARAGYDCLVDGQVHDRSL